LWYALRRLRALQENDEWAYYPIWIDALCINQTDSTERDDQVRMMSDIYKTAYGVVIWLGEDDASNNCSKGMKFLNELILREESHHYLYSGIEGNSDCHSHAF
jgi:hypothetical protein